MVNYAEFYTYLYEGEPFKLDLNTGNVIFDNIFAWWGSARLGYTSFFLFIAISGVAVFISFIFLPPPSKRFQTPFYYNTKVLKSL